MTQIGQQATVMKVARPHTRVMMTQMIINEGIAKFGNKENDALLKELNQLHEQ